MISFHWNWRLLVSLIKSWLKIIIKEVFGGKNFIRKTVGRQALPRER
jgi:hypothetical protein